MIVRVGSKIPIFDFGWLCIDFSTLCNISQLSLTLSRPILLPVSDLETVTKGEIRKGALCKISWYATLENSHVEIDDRKFKFVRTSLDRGPVYWPGLELCISHNGRFIDFRDLTNVLRPRVLSQLSQLNVIELYLKFVKDVDPRQVVPKLKIRYLFPIVERLHMKCIYKVRGTLADQNAVKAFENFVFSKFTQADLELLSRRSIAKRCGILTLLGMVLKLTLTPYLMCEEELSRILRECKC